MITFDFLPVFKFAEQNNIVLPNDIGESLSVYGNMLIEWNKKINLTAITEPEEIVSKHFLDCIALLKIIKPKQGQTLLDVGTGAGFPGMVLKIASPNLKVTLLDGHAKRFLFLEDLQRKLGITAENLHARAELAAKEEQYRESFDFVTARAVAKLQVLSEYCLPFVKPGGMFISMKGPEAKAETEQAQNAIKLLGGSRPELFYESLISGERVFALSKKISQTPTKYPRISAKITKQPL